MQKTRKARKPVRVVDIADLEIAPEQLEDVITGGGGGGCTILIEDDEDDVAAVRPTRLWTKVGK